MGVAPSSRLNIPCLSFHLAFRGERGTNRHNFTFSFSVRNWCQRSLFRNCGGSWAKTFFRRSKSSFFYIKHKVYNKIYPRSLGGSSKVCCYLRHPRSSSPPFPPEQYMRSGSGGAPTGTREKGGLNIPKRGPDRRRVVYVDTKYPSLFSPSLASLTCYRRRRH